MQKMKRRKMSVIAVSMIFIFLISASNSNAFTTHTVSYPKTVKLGETIDVNIIFSYAIEANCLFGEYAYLHWMINNETTSTTWTYGSRACIYNLENYPRISNVSWSYDTLVMYYGNLAIDDVFQFKIRYYTGYDWGDKITFEGIARTETYEITIVGATTEKTSAGIITSIFVLAAIVTFTRKRKVKVDPHA